MNVWELLQILLTAFEIGMCLWLCDVLIYDGEFIRDRKGYLAGGTLLLTMIIIYSRQDTFFSWPIFILQIFCIWLIQAFGKKENKVLCFVVAFDFQLITTLLDLVLSFLVISYLDEGFWENLYYGVGMARLLIYFLSRSVMTGICVTLWKCRKKYRFHVEDYRGVLFSVGVIGTVWGWLLLNMLEEQGSQVSLGDSFLIVSCLLILLILMAIELRSSHLKAATRIVRMKNELLEQSYRDMQKLYENNQYISHDFKNHMILLRNYLDRKEYDRALVYLDEITKPIEKLSNYTHTGCEMLDLAINIKRSEAEQKGIQYMVESDREIHPNIDENDLGNIFFNLLDNAIEACEKIEESDKWIRIAIKKKKQIYIMKVENSIGKPIILQEGKYITEKDNKECHGLGMKSVESSVRQYGGDVKWSHTKDRFTAVITFFGNGL